MVSPDFALDRAPAVASRMICCGLQLRATYGYENASPIVRVIAMAPDRNGGGHRAGEAAPTHPVRTAALDHLVLRVADLQRSTAFYRDVLGCAVEKWQPEFGLLQLRAGSSLIDLVTLDGPLGREGGAGPAREGRNLDHFCLRLTHFDEPALRAHLAAYGIAASPSALRYGAEGYGVSLYIQDPDGNSIELKAPCAG
jgi:catechol 2,3-dioxygenase-like lactoylglutathione lyase family enzyme